MSHNNKAVCLVSSEGSSGSRAVCGMGRGGVTLTVGVGTDEDPDATAGGDVVRRQGVDVAADSRPAQRRLPRAGLPAPHSRRPHGGRLPAWLLDTHTNAHARTHTHAHTHIHGTQKGHVSWRGHGRTRRHMDRRACLRADSPGGPFTRARAVNHGKGTELHLIGF